MGVDLRSRLAGAAGQARNEVPKEPGTFLPPKKQARTPCMHLASTPERAVPEKPERPARPLNAHRHTGKTPHENASCRRLRAAGHEHHQRGRIITTSAHNPKPVKTAAASGPWPHQAQHNIRPDVTSASRQHQARGSVTPRWPWYLPPRSRYDTWQTSSDSKNSTWAQPSPA